MGIRFFCPSGHRLHVKSFLAGKRGVCPDCGTSVEIPLESDARALTSKKKLVVGGDVAADDARATAVLDHPEPGPENGSEHEPPEVDISIRSGKESLVGHNDFDLPPGLDQPDSSTTPAPAFSVASVSTSKFVLETELPAAPPSISVAPAQQPPSVPRGKPVEKPILPVGAAVAVSNGVVAHPEPPIAPLPPVSDAISEAPQGIWYVRPTAGGQFGPARGDVMRKWLAEGRVPVDSLVWREGWPDWRPAVKIFPELASKGSTTVDPMLPIVADAPRRVIRPTRKASTAQGVGLVIVLALVCVGLFAALIYVLASGGGATPTP